MRNGEIHQGLVDPDRKENTSCVEEIQWEFGQIVRHRPTHDPRIEEDWKLPYGVYYLQEEDWKPITPCGQQVHQGNGSVKSLLSVNSYK